MKLLRSLLFSLTCFVSVTSPGYAQDISLCMAVAPAPTGSNFAQCGWTYGSGIEACTPASTGSTAAIGRFDDTNERAGGCGLTWRIKATNPGQTRVRICREVRAAPGTSGQCGGIGTFCSAFSDTNNDAFTRVALDDTDDRAGFCQTRFLLEEDGAGLPSKKYLYRMCFENTRTGVGQCNLNSQPASVTSCTGWTDAAAWSDFLTDDTDNRAGGCQQRFWVEKKPNTKYQPPQCSDGIDNDGDGATDYPADFACSSVDDTNENDVKAQCQDGLDNDTDDFSDYPADVACTSTQDNDEGDRKTQCQDDLDNDRDGASDYPKDFACSSTQDDDEGDRKAQCQDARDNDGDGATDYPADFACTNSQDNDEGDRKAECQDLRDNDGDGASDYPADFACDNLQDNSESDRQAQCQDGRDNDGDGATDYPLDFACSSPQDNNEGDKKAQCQDGLDNDGDGLKDFPIDPGCGSAQDNDEVNGRPQCSDGIDNDRDGATDFPADFACTSAEDNDEGDKKAQCQDGIDNDKDGVADHPADFACSSPQDNDEGDKKAQCQDGVDNDGDGFIDYPSDLACSSPQDNDEGDRKFACQDGVDNDNDGLVDLKDPGCTTGQDDNESDDVAKLQVSTECVQDNKDGTYTGYFSYENLSGVELNVTTDVMLSTVNAFSPGAENRGQITRFKTGKVRGAVAIVFDGGELTWKVRALSSGLSSTTVSSKSVACKPLEPRAECVDGDVNGFKATMGYTNPNAFEARVAVGPINSFSPEPSDRGQPSLFLAGNNTGAFNISFKEPFTWTLTSNTATVTAQTPICPGGCIDTPVGTVKSELDQAAVALSNLAKKSADFLAARAKKRLAAQAARAVAVDAQRAKKRADALVAEANKLTVELPGVIKSCPNSAPFCQTVDRGPTIEALKSLYARQVNAVKRIISRGYFNQLGTTNRKDATIASALTLQAQGLEAVTKLPRFATECK
jgi:hypothetical protein